VLLVPLALGAWFLDSVLAGNEEDTADVRLAAGLNGATTETAAALAGADETARGLARSPRVQRALRERDGASLARIALARPAVSFEVDGVTLAGQVPPDSIRRAVDVVGDEGPLGRVVVSVPLDDALVGRLTTKVRLGEDDGFALVSGGRIVVGRWGVGNAVRVTPGEPEDVELDGREYRALAAPLPGGEEGQQTLALTPRSTIDEVVSDRRWRIVVASLVTFLSLAAVAFLLAPLAERRLRFLRRERRRFAGPGDDAREALALVGDAFAATHDQQALPPVILETMIEATGAVGGRLVAQGRQVAQVGETGDEERALRLELGGQGWEGTLVLYPPAEGFTEEARELAQWLASQASVALENARLHAIVKQQAVTDSLTGLANRRRFMEEMGEEVRRADRFGTPLAVVLADLDDFKSINDRFGHQAGDDVLRAFASVLRDRLREIDLPARLGGEEFAILLRQTDLTGGAALAEQLRSRLATLRLAAPGGAVLRVTASFGVAAYPRARSEDELLSTADAALYRAKALGKNRVVEADSELPPDGPPRLGLP